nr:hypothetical protein [Rikenellaceae bacterium]
PLKIHIDERYEILDCEIIYQKNLSNGFSIILSEDKKSVLLNFDYFDYLEGLIIQICHTGNSSSDFSLHGQVKSCNQINKKTLIRNPFPIPKFIISYLQKSEPKFTRQVAGWMMFMSGIGVLFYSVFLYFNDEWQLLNNMQSYNNLMSLLIGVICSLLYFTIGYRIIKRQIPKGFDIFNEEF